MRALQAADLERFAAAILQAEPVATACARIDGGRGWGSPPPTLPPTPSWTSLAPTALASPPLKVLDDGLLRLGVE